MSDKMGCYGGFFFFKQKTAYDMRISDWSSDVCSSDLPGLARGVLAFLAEHQAHESSSFLDAAPGKIMHETRKGEMARLHELPFGLYYGGVDTTPLHIGSAPCR